MSEYEMASLHTELFNAVQSSVTVLLSVLSGFLLISFFAAHRLDRITAAVGLATFIGYVLLNVAGTSGALISYARLTHEMRAYAASGQGLEWHNAARAPSWVVDALSPAILVAGAVVLLASVHFFFRCRHINRTTDVTA
jgi:hypothetical protein